MNSLFIPQPRQVLHSNLAPDQAALQLIPGSCGIPHTSMLHNPQVPQNDVQWVADLVRFHTDKRRLFDLCDISLLRTCLVPIENTDLVDCRIQVVGTLVVGQLRKRLVQLGVILKRGDFLQGAPWGLFH